MTQEPDKKTVAYKFPKDGSLLQKKEDDIIQKEMSSIDVPENVLDILEKKDATIVELQEFKDGIISAQKSDLSTTLAYNEFLIGRLVESELEDRQKSLSEKAPEILKELSEVIGDHPKLTEFRDSVKAFLTKNPDKTIKDAAVMWAKLSKAGKPTIPKVTKENGEEEADAPPPSQTLAVPVKETAELSQDRLKQADHALYNTMAKNLDIPGLEAPQ